MRTRLILGIVVVLFLMFALIFKGPSITGYVPHETFSQGLDIHLEKSQRYYLVGDSNISLTGVAISGNVEGSGLVNVYLIHPDTDERLLIFSNKVRSDSAMQHITGLAVVELVPGENMDLIETLDDGYVANSGAFVNECEQTCLMDSVKGCRFTLEFVVEPGTVLDVTKLRYTLAQG